jgi:DNA mismatch repair protein MutS2
MDSPENPFHASVAALEWPAIVLALAARAATPQGQALVANLAFLESLEAIRRSLATVGEMAALIAEAGPLPFAAIRDVAPLLERAEKEGRLELDELQAVLGTQRGAVELARGLRAVTESPLLRELAEGLHLETELIRALDEAIAPSGALSERAYPRLAELRHEIAARRDAIHRHLDALLRSRDLDTALQDKVYTLRGRRYVVPVRTDSKNQLPGIVHDVSASGMTLFVEPQAVMEETNALTLAERHLEIETERILRELSAEVGKCVPSLRHNLGWVGRVDRLHAQALLGRAMQAAAPEVLADGEISLNGAGHPLMLLRGEEVIRNDVNLGADARCLIVSGANTGGKTVLLKTIGLCSLLVRAGMPIPARKGSRFDFFPDLWAEVGDQQDLRASLSTFSAQVAFLARVLDRAGPGSLVLLDELMTGTEPVEGAALARQVLAALAARGAKVIVTTHYGELKLLAGEVPGVVNGSVTFDAERLRPTYRFLPGVPGASYAFPIALRHGLPPDLVQAAEASLAGRPAAVDALVRGLHDRQERLDAEAAELQRRVAEHRGREADLERRQAALAELQARLKQQERGAVSREMEEARRKIAAVIESLQAANSLPLAGAARERLRSLEHEVLPPPAAPPAATPAPPPRPGGAVYVPTLERTGELLEVLAGGERARVRFGALTLELPMGQVLPPRSPAAPAPDAQKRPPGAARSGRRGAAPSASGAPAEEIPPAFPSSENTVDVRGMNLEDALAEVERFFDHCVMKHVSPVVVIHGHGVGRLKNGLREQFKGSRYVHRFRPGSPSEGRDGVTVVALNL